MKVVAVVGAASGSGKTTLVCAVLRALPGLGAVKISPREGEVRVEWGAGQAGKDTARFVASGAALVARLVGPRERIPETWERVRPAFASLPGVLVEGAGALALPEDRFTIFVVAAEALGERPERDERLAAVADCIAVVQQAAPADGAPTVSRHLRGMPVFLIAPDAQGHGQELLTETIRGFLLDKEGIRASIPLDPPLSEGEESRGGSINSLAPPSPKRDTGG